MGTFSWHKDALASKRVIARVARRGGKTTAALKWARSAGEHVLFLASNQSSVEACMNQFTTMYRDECDAVQGNKIRMNDGRKITFVAASKVDGLHGLRADAIVMDEIGYMTSDEVASAVSRVSAHHEIALFATYSYSANGGVEPLAKHLKGVNYITVDYLDLVEDGSMEPSQVRHLKNFLSEAAFELEFGPFEREIPKVQTNKGFKHLLTS